MEYQALFDKMNAVIEKIYIGKDYDLYRKRASRPDFPLSSEIIAFTKDQGIQIVDCHKNTRGIAPVSCWEFIFPDFQTGENLTKYATYFAISKIADLFYIDHKFQIKDLNPDCLSSDGMLCGSGYLGKANIQEQGKLESLIEQQMKDNGIEKLSFGDSKVKCVGLVHKKRADCNDGSHPKEYFQTSYYDLFFDDAMGILE